MALVATACLGGSGGSGGPHASSGSGDTPAGRALAAVRASKLVRRLERGSAAHLRVFSTSSDSVAIAVDLDPPVSLDVTIPVSDGGRSSSYHLTARGISQLDVTVLDEGSRIVYIVPEWKDGFELEDAHWVGPDLGFPPAGGG